MKSTSTFAKLGIPFPLFEAPTTEAVGSCGSSQCVLCKSKAPHCFNLRVGGYVILMCPDCHDQVAFSTADRSEDRCRTCKNTIPFPAEPGANVELEGVCVCYDCLRAGKAAFTHDTEFGMVRWKDAVRGVTHGVPGLKVDGYERVRTDSEEDWFGVRIDRKKLLELVRTPTFPTWQGSRWLFCCQSPMIYVGEWQSVRNSPAVRQKQERFCRSLRVHGWSADQTWKYLSGPLSISVYVFRCGACDGLRANYDMS